MKETIPKILVAEGSPEAAAYIQKILTLNGFDVFLAFSLEEAERFVAKGSFDLVLMDLNFAGQTVESMTQRIKQAAHESYLPVMLVANQNQEDALLKSFEQGAVDYVTKPINSNILIARLLNQLNFVQLEKKLKSSVEHLEKEVQRRAKVEKQLRLREKELERFVWIDGLTSISNRRKFDDYLDFQWRQKLRSKEPISIIMCDIDFFKQYNDCYGHQQGDDCLIQVANLLVKACRRSDDLACRYGGEEFCVVLPNTAAEGAHAIANVIRNSLINKAIPHERSSLAPYVTMSMGVSTIVPSVVASKQELIEEADKWLYTAKSRGRNRICPEIV